MVAADFQYLRKPAGKYGNFYLADEFESFVDQASGEQLAELAAAYDVIASRDDSFRISNWIHDCADREKRTPEPETSFSRQVGQMFLLFDHLARRGIQPFRSRRVEPTPIFKKPNWGSLPKELAYLIEVAEAYGVYSSESEMLDFLEHAHPKDMEVLAKTAERMRSNGHSVRLDEWMDEHQMEKHQEAWMTYCLLGLMDHAGLKFEPRS